MTGRGKKKRSWFGFLLHLLHLVVDANYELPVAFEVTRASAAEQPVAQQLLDQLEQRHDTVLERCAKLSADTGYDDSKLIKRLWDQHQIKPVIVFATAGRRARPASWSRGRTTCSTASTAKSPACVPKTGDEHSMYYAGIESDRNTLKYRCPAHASGIECKGMDQCPLAAALQRNFPPGGHPCRRVVVSQCVAFRA